MDNITKGVRRGSRLVFTNSLSIAKGEANELESQIYRVTDRGFISTDKRDNTYEEIDLLTKNPGNFIRYLNSTDIKAQKFKNR